MAYDLEEVSLNKVCRLISILPRLEIRRKYKQTYIKPIATVVALIGMCLATYYYKFVYVKHIILPSIFYTVLVYDAALFMPVVASIILLNLKHGRKLHELLLKLHSVDAKLRKIEESFAPKVPLSFYGEAFFIHGFVIGFVGMEMYLWIGTLGWRNYLKIAFRDYENYHVVTVAMVLRFYALLIKRRFQAVNEILGDTGKRINVKDVAEIYTDVVQAIRSYSAIFGWQFVFLYVLILVNLLMSISSSLIYSGGKHKISGNTYGVDVLMMTVFWGMLPILIAISMYSACEATTKEARKTAAICYEAYQRPNARGNRKQLLKLAKQSSQLNLQFSAAGYFFVSHRTLFELFGSVTSYLIVIIQFNK